MILAAMEHIAYMDTGRKIKGQFMQAVSSVGEHLLYAQSVGGSNPSPPIARTAGVTGSHVHSYKVLQPGSTPGPSIRGKAYIPTWRNW